MAIIPSNLRVFGGGQSAQAPSQSASTAPSPQAQPQSTEPKEPTDRVDAPSAPEEAPRRGMYDILESMIQQQKEQDRLSLKPDPGFVEQLKQRSPSLPVGRKEPQGLPAEPLQMSPGAF